MTNTSTYKALKTDLTKLETNIAGRQKRCQQSMIKNDLLMAQMYERDVKDLTDILNFTTEGDFESAWRIIEWVDTVVRDELPARLYNFIAKENGYH